LAAAVVGNLQTAEADFQNSLNNAFNDTLVGTYKALRRALPVTRTKLDWNAVAACIDI
jgi:capping protein alpha